MEGVAAKQALVDRYQRDRQQLFGRDRRRNGAAAGRDRGARALGLGSKVDQAMDALRCPDADAKVETLSGGERRRVALCKLLLDAPDILLLDEPTNHLDAESVEWLEATLREYKGCVIWSPMTAISWTMSPAGFSNWIAARAFPMKAISPFRKSGKAPKAGIERGSGAKAHHRARTRMDQTIAQGAPGQIPGPHQCL